jgi:quinohemoprotein ethanol dehydrogenase
MVRSGRVLLVTCAIGIAAAHLRGQSISQPSDQASADGAAVFKRRCASCHEGTADERAPSRTALRDRTPQQVLDALTNGVMTAQGSALTDAERRAVAEYLTGRAVGGSTVAPREGNQSAQELSPEQLRLATTRDTNVRLVPLPKVDRTASRDWPLHNLDLANSRYSPLKQINASNIKSVAVKWLYHTRNAGSTPIVVDGVMYVATSDHVVALDATTGRPIWISTEASSGRGAAYGDGKIYVAKDARIWALDAKTGKLAESFGKKGISHVLSEVLKVKYPQLEKPADWGYSFNMAPQYYDGVIIIGTALSENHIPGGLILGVDARSGSLLWQFWGVPQGPGDEGWEIAKDTWVGGVRHGGGIWATPSVDPESGTLYLTVANPSPDQDGSARKGLNLFTNGFVALDVRTGKLKWHFQQVHHDLWDYDAGQQPTLFDIRVGGRMVKAVAAANKNGYVYILNRETGQPINPIVETPVPTKSEVPGEEVWPTQPIPHTAAGKPMKPTASQEVSGEIYPQHASYPRLPFYTPPTLKGAVHAPREAVHYGSSSFSPAEGLLYVAGKELPIFLTAIPVGATLKNGQFSTAGKRESAAPEAGNVSAYDPATGEMIWRTPLTGGPSAGTTTTAGNLVFVADRQGTFYALDAKTGKLLWDFYTGAAIRAAQITYQVNGVQYLTVASGGNLVMTFALPTR